VFICQHRQTRYRSFVSVVNPVVVNQHPLGKFSLLCALHFNVDIYPVFITIQHIHPDQPVNNTRSQLGILHYGPQLLIQKNIAL